MEQKKRLWKLTGYVLLILAVCTGLAKQFRQMQMPQVTVAPIASGTILHEDVYPAVPDAAGDGTVRWQLDEQGYAHYGENRKAALMWTDADGGEQTEVFGIADKIQNPDGIWEFTMNIPELSARLLPDTQIQVRMEAGKEYEYTVPLSALSMDAYGYKVYTIETHQGIFSDEQRVQSWYVEVTDQDSVSAAVSSGRSEQVVAYTSKPLQNRMQVTVVQ